VLATDERTAASHRRQDLFATRTKVSYTQAERRYSAAIQSSITDLLEGRLNRLLLLRRYHDDPDRVAVMRGPRGVDPENLRMPVVEEMLTSTLAFVRDETPGGPVCQREEGDHLLETQQFSTRYPHIIIERLDAFSKKDQRPLFSEWRLRRIQNQRAETQINRWLDAATLGLTLFRAFRGSAS
jgi:hypothetical protein